MSETCVCISLRKASRKLTAREEAALDAAGSNHAQFSRRHSNDRLGPVSLTALSETPKLNRSPHGHNVRVLERLSLVAIGGGKDQREAMLSLSPNGKTTLAVALPLWEGTQDAIRTKLGADGVAQLTALLGAL